MTIFAKLQWLRRNIQYVSQIKFSSRQREARFVFSATRKPYFNCLPNTEDLHKVFVTSFTAKDFFFLLKTNNLNLKCSYFVLSHIFLKAEKQLQCHLL